MFYLMARRRHKQGFLVIGITVGILLGCGRWLFLDYWNNGYSSGIEIHPLLSNTPVRDEPGGNGEVEPPPIKDLALRLRDRDDAKRVSALSELGKLGKEGKPLRAKAVLLLDDGNLEVRREAASALFRIEGNESIPILANYLKTDPDSEFCARIVGVISRLPPGDVSAISSYILCLKREEESFNGVVTFACNQLIQRGKYAVPGLLQVIKNKEEKTTFRAIALDTLNRIAPTTEEVVSILVPLVDDADDNLSKLAIYGLGRIGVRSTAARRSLEKAVLKGITLSRRLEAAEALYKLDPANRLSVPAFIAGLRSEDETMRWVSANQLWEMGAAAKEAVPALKDVLGDEKLEVRRSAIQALGRIGPAAAPAIPRLLELKNDPSESVRVAVEDALAKIQLPPMRK